MFRFHTKLKKKNIFIFFLNIFVKWENIIISVGQDKITNESPNKRQRLRRLSRENIKNKKKKGRKTDSKKAT